MNGTLELLTVCILRSFASLRVASRPRLLNQSIMPTLIEQLGTGVITGDKVSQYLVFAYVV